MYEKQKEILQRQSDLINLKIKDFIAKIKKWQYKVKFLTRSINTYYLDSMKKKSENSTGVNLFNLTVTPSQIFGFVHYYFLFTQNGGLRIFKK